jgi:hypothetical protein
MTALEILESIKNNLLIDEAEKEFHKAFEERRNEVIEDYRTAIDPEYYIDKKITEIEDTFWKGLFDKAGILNFKEGNDLVKWGFDFALERPRMQIWEAGDILRRSSILLMFGTSDKPTVHLQGLSKLTGDSSSDQFSTLNLNLTEDEYLLEAFFYVFYGAASAGFLSFLKDIKNHGVKNNNQIETKGLRHQALRLIFLGEPLPENEKGKLLQHYSYYSQKNNRTGTEKTLLKQKNKIVLFEGVIKTLPKNKRQRVLDELKILKNNLSSFF